MVSPNDVKILDAYSGPGMNLITCYPFYYVGPAPQRFIVHANENGESFVSQAGSSMPVPSRPVNTNEAPSN